MPAHESKAGAQQSLPFSPVGAEPQPAVEQSHSSRLKAPSLPVVVQHHSGRLKAPSLSVPTANSPNQETPPLAPLLRHKQAQRLWLSLYFPQLFLDLVLAEQKKLKETLQGTAVFAEGKGNVHIVLVDAIAANAGISPGLSVNAALALLPELQLQEYSAQRANQALQKLAAWACKFTSLVSIEPPAGLLLEVAGSARLFGGLEPLLQRLTAALQQRGFAESSGLAPTPLAARWLARACWQNPGRQNFRRPIKNRAELPAALAAVPLSCLDWPATVQSALQGMGVTTVGACLRLPRAGFCRRFGVSRLLDLDRALGRLPDPRRPFQVAERFSAEYELGAELDDRELLLNAAQELLARLEQFLLERQQGVQALVFSLFHLRAPATHLRLSLLHWARSAERWFDLLKIRFERLDLSAPVIAMQLDTGPGQPLAPDAEGMLLQAAEAQRAAAMPVLVERLKARLGTELVHGVATVAEYRPQYAWQPAEPARGTPPHCAAQTAYRIDEKRPDLLVDIRRSQRLVLRRPLWILEQPLALITQHGQPMYQGLLSLIDGPERLETGWWDAQGIRRDYYIAKTIAGIHLWVFQARSPDARWFLHGLFE